MARHRTVVAVDSGTDYVRVVVAEGDAGGRLAVLGVGASAVGDDGAGGARDEALAIAALTEAKLRAERNSGTRILSAYAGLPPTHSGKKRTYAGVTPAPDPVVASRRGGAGKAGAETGSRRSRSYMQDAPRGDSNQEAVSATEAGEPQDVLLDSAADPRHDVAHRFERAGLALDGLVSTPLAAAESVLTRAERLQGTLLVDIGASGTLLALFHDDRAVWTGSVPIGGRSFTSDLAIVLEIAVATAEDLKLRHGRASSIQGDETRLATVGRGGGRRSVERQMVHEIINARAEQLLEVIASRVSGATGGAHPLAGLVVTGGAALLPELVELAGATFGVPARVGAPRNLAGRTGTLSGPAFATVAGIARLGLAHDVQAPAPRRARSEAADRPALPWPGALPGWIRDFLQ